MFTLCQQRVSLYSIFAAPNWGWQSKPPPSSSLADHITPQAAIADPSKPGPLLNAALQRRDDGDLVEARELYSR